MEGRNKGNLLHTGDMGGCDSGHEGAVGMDYPELSLEKPLEEERIDLGNPCDIRGTERYRYGHVVQDFVSPVTIVDPRIAGSDDGDTSDLFLHPPRVVFHAYGDSVHHWRKTLVEKTYISVNCHVKNYSTYSRRPLRYSPSG